MTRKEAEDRACEESRNGYVVHVNILWDIPENGTPTIQGYRLCDWQSDSTVASYENGKKLL